MLKHVLLIGMCDQKSMETTALDSFKCQHFDIN